MNGALLSALLVLLLAACRQDAPQQQTTSTTATPSVTSTVDATPSTGATASDWTDANSPQAIEVAVAPERAAVVVFDAMKGGYIVQRGGQSRPLPREWFGVGPARRDISISADGRQLAIPDETGVVLYDVDAKRWLKRVDAPAAGSKGKLSADAKHVVWTSPKGECSMTEVATGTLKKKCS